MNHNTQRILVVEDDDVLRAGLQDFLVGQGLHATCSRDGEEALQIISREKEPFDVVLTDLVMPLKDGLEVLRVVKEHSPKTQVVIITGFASLETAIDSMHQGAFDYITKPFQFVEIEIVLGKIAERKKLIDENLRLSESIQSLYSRLELLKDTRAKFDRFITETSEKLDQQSQKIDNCMEMIRKLSHQLELAHPAARIIR
jgi:two-component system, NtrC family, response regulator AtoC